MQYSGRCHFCDYIFIEKEKASGELAMEEKNLVDDQQEWLKIKEQFQWQSAPDISR